MLEDIHLAEGVNTLQNKFVMILKEFFQQNASILNYDGQQFYSHLYSYLKKHLESNSDSNSKLMEVLETAKHPPVLSLIPLNEIIESENTENKSSFHAKQFDLITRLPDTEQFVVTVSTNNEEICVWDIRK